MKDTELQPLYRVLCTYNGAPGRLVFGNNVCGQLRRRNKSTNQTKDLSNRHAEQKRIGLEYALRWMEFSSAEKWKEISSSWTGAK